MTDTLCPIVIDSTPQLVCLCYTREESSATIAALQRVIEHNAIILKARTGEFLECHVSDLNIVDCRQMQSRIIFYLSRVIWEEIISAMQEHALEDGEWPLDHPLEPLGVKRLPNTVSDVVFETTR